MQEERDTQEDVEYVTKRLIQRVNTIINISFYQFFDSSHEEVKTSQKQSSSISDVVEIDETSQQVLPPTDGDNKSIAIQEEEIHPKKSFSKTMNVT